MSDSSPKSDRSKWIVPIVVAFIAAIGTVIAALVPSLFSSDEEAVPSSLSGLDTIPSVADGKHDTDQPVPRGPADTATTPVISHSGYEQLVVVFNDLVVDLDSSSDGTGGDNIADLVLTEFALTTGGSARITPLDRVQIPTLDVCRSALEQGGVDTIPAAQLEDGSPLCVMTTAGRIGALTEADVRKGGNPVQISMFFFNYMIWKATGR